MNRTAYKIYIITYYKANHTQYKSTEELVCVQNEIILLSMIVSTLNLGEIPSVYM